METALQLKDSVINTITNLKNNQDQKPYHTDIIKLQIPFLNSRPSKQEQPFTVNGIPSNSIPSNSIQQVSVPLHSIPSNSNIQQASILLHSIPEHTSATSSNFFSLTNKFRLFLFFLAVILIGSISTRLTKTKREGFSQKKKYIYRRGNDIYDKFYCSIYDDLFYYESLHNFHCEMIEQLIPTKHKAQMLDIGSGTGHLVDYFSSKKINITGIDKSPHMIKLAKQNYPKCDFKTGDALTTITFGDNYFTHITCLYFTIYYMKNKALFFQNCYTWLKSNGLLVIHLVNREMFDPILPAGDPLLMISAQKYADKRITKTAVKFKDFEYKAEFTLDTDNDLAIFSEKFKDDATGNKRQNEHHLFMEEQKEIIYLARSAGFKIEQSIDMVACQYEYQTLYVLRKI